MEKIIVKICWIRDYDFKTYTIIVMEKNNKNAVKMEKNIRYHKIVENNKKK